MTQAGCNLDKIIDFRQKIHQHPEGGFKEFETQKKIKEILVSFGLEEENIKPCAGTGFVVDIKGKGPQTSEGAINTIALRADMDGLPMPECNPDLPYKSKTDYAHMCGHDGHMATLTSAAEVLIRNRDKIPSNKTIRLLY